MRGTESWSTAGNGFETHSEEIRSLNFCIIPLIRGERRSEDRGEEAENDGGNRKEKPNEEVESGIKRKSLEESS